MKSMRMVAAVLISVAFAAAAFGHTASDNGPQRLIVLLQPGSAPLPDIAALGGSVEFQLADRMIVTVPAGAVAAISGNPRVKFVQRSSAPATVRAESLPVVPATGSGQWTTGAYVYDGAGNISAIGTNAELNSDAKTNSYAYDKVGRLVKGTANYAAGDRSEIYEYDPAGNMTHRKPTGAPEVIYQIDSLTNHAGQHNAAGRYDAAGNEVSDPAITATRRFDVLNMMTYKHTGTVEEYYVYTPDEQRIGVLDAVANTWTWSLRDESGAPLRQYASSETARTADWVWIEDYVYAGGRLLAAERMASQGGRRHFHLDHLGTPRLITGPTGTLMARHDYLPFGEEITPRDDERRQFTGHERDSGGDPAAMLDYMHARYYRSYVGRFLSVDPAMDLKKTQPNPQEWNRYAYVVNNPLRYNDPDGREHVQEPGFTKPLSEANDWAQRPEVSWAFHAQGFLLSLAADEFLIGPAVGKLIGTVGRVAGRFFAKSEEAIEAGSTFSRYENVTKGRSIANRATNVSRADFAKNLEANGFTKTVSKDGKVTNFVKDNIKYTIRDTAKSTGGPTVDVSVRDTLIAKIRLEVSK